jgi:hypothetical protein
MRCNGADWAATPLQMREEDEWVGCSWQHPRPGGEHDRLPHDVGLPLGGGWEWAGDWTADTHLAGCDAEGHQYHQGTQEGRCPAALWCSVFCEPRLSRVRTAFVRLCLSVH